MARGGRPRESLRVEEEALGGGGGVVKHQTGLGSRVVVEGAQAFRQRMALSLVANKLLTIQNIRVADELMPGLRPSEACIVELAQKLTDNADIRISGGHAACEVRVDDPGILLGSERSLTIDCPPDRGLSYYLEFLLLIAPFSKFGLRGLTLKGVTDHPLDLSIDSFRAGFAGAWKRIGATKAFVEGAPVDVSQLQAFPEVDIQINSRGLLPAGGGSVTVSCGIFNRKLGCLKPFNLVYPGRVSKVRGVAYTCHMNPMFATKTMESARGVLNQLLADVHVYTEIAKGDKAGASSGFGLSLVAETLKGTFVTADSVVDKHHESRRNLAVAHNARDKNFFPAEKEDPRVDALQASFLGRKNLEDLLGKGGKRTTADLTEHMSQRLGREVALRLVAEVAQGGALSTPFQWVGIYFMAMAEDTAMSKLVLGRLSPHSVCLLRALKEMTGIEFTIQTFEQALAAARDSQPSKSSQPDEAVAESSGAVAESGGADSDSGLADGDALELLKRSRNEDRLVLTCRGIGYANLSRVAF